MDLFFFFALPHIPRPPPGGKHNIVLYLFFVEGCNRMYEMDAVDPPAFNTNVIKLNTELLANLAALLAEKSFQSPFISKLNFSGE